MIEPTGVLPHPLFVVKVEGGGVGFCDLIKLGFGNEGRFHSGVPRQIKLQILSDYAIVLMLPPTIPAQKEVCNVDQLVSFLISVTGSVVAGYITKWLDRCRNNKRQ